jgi:hypothetical protein
MKVVHPNFESVGLELDMERERKLLEMSCRNEIDTIADRMTCRRVDAVPRSAYSLKRSEHFSDRRDNLFVAPKIDDDN